MSPNISRRELLKNGAKAAAALSVLPALTGEAEAQRARGARRGAAPKGGALARLDEYVGRHMREAGAPGMTLALADRGGAVRVSSYGLADTKTAAPVKPETLFEVGSISKSFAAVALLQMLDEGRVDLHRPVVEYLPWLKLEQRHGAVTAHHLLSHTSGLPGAPLLPESVAVGLETFFKPGEKFVYSNIGYLLLGLLVEALDRRPFADALAARVLKPLGMNNSSPLISHSLRPRMAVGYSPEFEDRPFPLRGRLAEAAWVEVDTAAGGVASTSADMVAYMRMLLNRGAGGGRRLISENSFGLLTKPVVKAPFRGEEASYAYGLWVSQNEEGATHLRHTGGMVAFSSSLDVDLTNGVAAFASVNASLSGYRPVAVTKYALELLNAERAGRELPAPPAPPPPPDEVKNAAHYAGTYAAPDGRQLVLRAEGNRLLLTNKGRAVALERSGGADSFVVKHPEFELFRLVFRREGEKVVEAGHGADWYTNDRYRGPRTFDYPKEWDAYAGRYRHESAWYGSTRVVLRRGALWLEGEQELVALPDGSFSIGPPEETAERVRFLDSSAGRALRMNVSSVMYYRTYMP
ncbi:MAG TPA: serine hydrolase domain-containing protein [Pyrinomonadaceae bacterium]|jgi:CubicO group peptidase (beta-lactamase class C family)